MVVPPCLYFHFTCVFTHLSQNLMWLVLWSNRFTDLNVLSYSPPFRNLCLLEWNCTPRFYPMLHIDSLWGNLQVCAFAKSTVILLLKVVFKFHTSILFKKAICVTRKKLSILKHVDYSLSSDVIVISVNLSLLGTNICLLKVF